MRRFELHISHRGSGSRAFTLIEVVIAIVVLALSVPPTLSMLDSASIGRVDSVNTTRATYLSTIVLESVLADMTSSEQYLGFEALSDENVYLNTPIMGLYERLESTVEPYTQAGFAYSLSVSELVASDGLVSDDVGENVFRTVTVIVEFPSAGGSKFSMPISMMVSEM